MKIISEGLAIRLFDEMLDETTPEIVICGITFYPSSILKDYDPIAYETYFSDWVSEQEWEVE